MKGYKLYRVLGVVGAVCLPVAATAALLDLTTFQKDEVISSSAMNANFAALNEKIDALETQLAERPALGQFCGVTTMAKNGELGGYDTADELCSTAAPGCSADSHMCTATELLLHRPEKAAGWFATGIALDPLHDADCGGFETAASLSQGFVWSNGVPIGRTCDAVLAVMCCH